MEATTSSPWRWRDVVALDPQRRACPGRAPRRSPPGRAERVVRSEARLVLCSASACWALRCTVSIRSFLSPRCGMRRRDLGAAPLRRATPGRAPAGSGSAGTRTSLGTASPCLLAVELLEGVLDQVRRWSTASTLSVTQPRWPRTRPPRTWKIWTAASSSSSATAIRSASVASASTTALFSMACLQRLDVVAQPGRLLVLHLLGRVRHLLLQAAQVRAGAPGHEVAELLGQFAVLLGGDPADAGRGALADVAEQAGAADAGRRS